MTYRLLIFFFSFFYLYAQDSELAFPKATSEKREQYKSEMKKVISSELDLFRIKKSETSIKKSFEYMQNLNYFEDDGYNFLKFALADYPSKSESFYSNALETVYTLYEAGFEFEMENILSTTTNPRHFTIAVNVLQRAYPSEREKYLKILKERFKDYEKTPILKILSSYLEKSPSEYLVNRPSLKKLFSHDFGDNHFVLFSLQRTNRNYPGLVLIRKPDGKFLRREDGSIFTISQLARSISNMPSYVVNGNTPQGIFSIQTIKQAKSEVIGPTPAIMTALPFEVSVDKFFHNTDKKGKWDLDMYLTLFPPSWREYFPIQEAFIAGEIGRNAIYAHGTTVDTELFRDYSYYPNTPTKGCLSAKEIWSKKNGKSIYSDQITLLKAVKSLEPSNGYMIVLEVDDREMPVSLDDVLMDILEIEEN